MGKLCFIGLAVGLVQLLGQVVGQSYMQTEALYVADACSKRITSPGYPNGYNSGSSYRWDISADNDKLVMVTFTDVDLDAGNCDTYLSFVDITDTELVRYCGTSTDMPESVMANANAASVIFNVGQNPERGKRGFRADIQVFQPLIKIALPVTTTKATTTTKPATTSSATTTPTTTTKPTTVSTTTLSPLNPLSPNFRCGVKTSQLVRIINGQPTVPGEFPWQLQLRYSTYGAVCGATLISPRYAIGALHCFAGNEATEQSFNNPVRWTVVAGAYLRGEAATANGVQTRKITKVNVHPNFLTTWGSNPASWDPPSGQHDIVVLQLDQPIYPSENISYLCMPRDRDYANYSTSQQESQNILCQVTGWGVTQLGQIPPNSLVLQKVSVSLVSRGECNGKYGGGGVIANDMICANNMTYPGDSCQGDSGGPMQCRVYTPYVGYTPFELAGVVSWGIGCGDVTKPGVYTNPYNYLPWIKSIVGSDPLFYAVGNNY